MTPLVEARGSTDGDRSRQLRPRTGCRASAVDDPVTKSCEAPERPRGWSVDGDRSAVLLLRVWLADGARTFRGRLTTMDTSVVRSGGGETSVAVVSSPRDAAEVVRRWLDRFLEEATDALDDDEGPAARPEPGRPPGPNVH